MSAELVAFLHARYDEAEERYEGDAGSDDDERRAVLAERPNRPDVIVVHDAVHHLAEIAANRAIVNRYANASGKADTEQDPAIREAWEVIDSTLETVLCELAQPYIEHPDYEPKWKP